MAAGTISPGVDLFFLMAGLGSPQALASVDWASFEDASILSACSSDVHQNIILPKDLFMDLLAAQPGCLQCNFLIAVLKYFSQTSEGFWEQQLFQIPCTLLQGPPAAGGFIILRGVIHQLKRLSRQK